MGKFICKICGKEFDRVGNGVYCPGPHFRPCPICGAPVPFQRPSDVYKCCSSECTEIMKRRSKMKHGTRICAECGKEFVPLQATQKWCKGPHSTRCIVCGKEISYTCSPREKPRTCSQTCTQKLKEQTVLSRYGVSNVSQITEVQKKISQANSSERVAAKRQATCEARYGVSNVAQYSEVRQKISEVASSEEYLMKRAATCLKKYGHVSPAQNPEIIRKRQETCKERYGSVVAPVTKEAYAKLLLDPSKIDNYWAFKENPKAFIESHYSEKPTISQLEQDLGVTNTTIYNILIASGYRDLLSTSYSSLESLVYDFIVTTRPDLEVIRNDRSVIKPLEIDIYIPDLRLGFECNPGSTHNSSFPDPWGSPPKPYKYHQDKSLAARKAGVFLFHVFGHEWKMKNEIIKSMIRNLLHANVDRCGARETEVCEVSYEECRKFLEKNHRQGNLSSSVRLGLRRKTDGLLVSVMTFGKLRNTMGREKGENPDVWELSRFCSLCDTSVPGAAGKLFSYFINTYHPERVISFSDLAHTSGLLYEKLGFQQIHLTAPSYVWVDPYDSIYYHRVVCQKNNLRKLFGDSSIDIEHQTEAQIMEAHKFARVYDSGVYKWVWSK